MYFCAAMKQELSILIPVYNDDCTRLAAQLSRQAECFDNLRYEILVADDCSTDRETVAANATVNDLPNGRYIERPYNMGSAANRNQLARESQYKWLLFIDCDVEIADNNFLQNYLEEDDNANVVMGGIAIGGNCQTLKNNLRYRYEKQSEPFHTATKRSQRPFQSFRSLTFSFTARLCSNVLSTSVSKRAATRTCYSASNSRQLKLLYVT